MQTRLFAEQRHFGPASTFDTWTFDDVHDEKALRCGQFRDRSDEEFAELINAASSQDKEVQRAHGVDENANALLDADDDVRCVAAESLLGVASHAEVRPPRPRPRRWQRRRC